MAFRIIVLLALLAVMCLVPCCLFRKIPAVNSQLTKYDEFQQRDVNKTIQGDENFRRVAAICDEIGDNEQFELLERQISGHGNPAVFYYYRSSIPMSDGFKNVSDFMKLNGWHSIENLSMNHSLGFQKDDFRVIVQYGGMGDAEFGITCEIKSETER